MPKARQPISSAKDDQSSEDLLANMPIAQALKDADVAKLESLISSALPGTPSVSEMSIEKSAGEAFTGGRSTPVYHITCRIMRPKWPESRKRQFVAKLVEMPGNADSNGKLRKIRESYAIERRFYDVVAPKIRDNSFGLQLEVPKLLASDRDGLRPHPAVCFLMNDVRQKGHTLHPKFLSVNQAKRALKWIASFHSIFWNDSKSEPWRRDLWERGGFWTGNKDSDNGANNNNKKIATNWSQTLRWLQSNHPSWVSEKTKGLGKRIQNISEPLNKFLLSESVGCRGTLLHGDYKAANLFFTPGLQNGSTHNALDVRAQSVCAVDFQFAGAGVGAEDVAYLLFPDARGHFEEHEEDLLKSYHEELIMRLIEQRKGGPSSISFDTLRAYYQLSRLDFTRHLLERGWVTSTEGDALLIRSLETILFQIDGGNSLSNENDYLEKLSKFIS